MKVYLAEINTTPGDFSGNLSQILAESSAAFSLHADLVVFPELSICGYLTRDLLYMDDFIGKNLDSLVSIADHSRDLKNLTIAIGYADRSYKEVGKPFRNMAAIIRNGLCVATYQKQLLPFYDVFDEPRYYEPGQELCKAIIAGEVCGITICEDLWNDKGQDDYSYENNPVERYRRAGVKTIINLSSSPYYLGKVQQRANMGRLVTKGGMTLIYTNQIGGQDELVFDGHSMVAHDGRIVHMGRGLVDTRNRGASDAAERAVTSSGTTEELVGMLCRGLSDYVGKTGHKNVVINSSGGVDSAVVIALAAKVFGGDRVNCIMMPSKYSSDHSLSDAKELHTKFGCQEYEIPIDHDPVIEAIGKSLEEADDDRLWDLNVANPVAEENVQARMRGLMGAMYFSNAFGALPLTTGNKTELALGYCTLYGDMSGGFNPIGDLYKDQVVAVGRFLEVPHKILSKAPSAELRPGQTDEGSLMPYYWLNYIVRAFIEDYVSEYHAWCLWYKDIVCKTAIVRSSGIEAVKEEDYDRMIRLIKLNEFKRRQAAPCVKVSKMAFGMGRRMPLVSGY